MNLCKNEDDIISILEVYILELRDEELNVKKFIQCKNS